MTLHRREDGALGAFEQAGGPGVGDVGQEFEPLVAEGRDPFGRLFEGIAEVGVGAEGQAHGALVSEVVGAGGMPPRGGGPVSPPGPGHVVGQHGELLEEVVLVDALRGP